MVEADDGREVEGLESRRPP